jgi:GlpG protein
MRLLTTLPDPAAAQALADALYGAGVDAETRESAQGGTALWVLDEGDLLRSRQLLEEFERSPDSPRLVALRREAADRRRMSAVRARASRPNEVNIRKRWSSGAARGTVTLTLIAICVGVFLITGMGEEMRVVQMLTIARYGEPPFHSVLGGQVWRLLTPIFLHFSFLHIFFNMMWLYDLGGLMEVHRGPRFLLWFIVVVGIGSNVAQYVFGGTSLFGGMSGVVYALLGYVWLRGRFDPRAGFRLNRTIVILMLAWMLLGFSGVMRSIQMANIAHLSGLLLGCAWGYLSSGDLPRRLRR